MNFPLWNKELPIYWEKELREKENEYTDRDINEQYFIYWYFLGRHFISPSKYYNIFAN